MYFVWNPGVHLSIFVKETLWTNQASRIENMSRPFRINFQHRPALNIDVMLAGFLLQEFGVLIWDFDGEFLKQFLSRFKHRRRMSELGKHYEPHGQKRRGARDC